MLLMVIMIWMMVVLVLYSCSVPPLLTSFQPSGSSSRSPSGNYPSKLHHPPGHDDDGDDHHGDGDDHHGGDDDHDGDNHDEINPSKL